MYIFKNAFKCIGRAKGRSILLGVIALVIAVSACIGLSIRQAAESAREDLLEGISVTGTISFDRQSMMSGMGGSPEAGGGFDRGGFSEKMGASSGLSLEEYQKYAAAESVKGFYYTLTASVNGSDTLLPVSDEAETETDTSDQTQQAPGMPGGGMGGRFEQMKGAQSDFSIVGYSGEAAMTDFVAGTATVTEGRVFAEEVNNNECIISAELATYNSVAVGDSILLTNPNSETETYTLTVVGIYTDSAANENSFSMMGATSTDPANKICVSYGTLKGITDASAAVAVTNTDENTGREFSSAITGMLSATYVFADVAAYEQFEQDVRTLGLSDSYTVSSPDLASYETQLLPLETLSKMAGYFLIVILIIGAVVLVVLNVFSIRERKYEIGVLTAMGMKKGKVALQFLTEIFAVTLAAVVVGAGIGAISAVPVTNSLLENQVTAQSAETERVEQNFGRGDRGGNMQMPDGAPTDMPQMPEGDRGGFFGAGGAAANYITEVNSAVNLTVLLQLLGIAVLLTLVAGAVSVLFIMRYDPLKILANRD